MRKVYATYTSKTEKARLERLATEHPELTIDYIIEKQAAEEAAPTTDGLMTDLEQIKHFVLAGNATFTLVSKATKTRFTYKVRKPSDRTPHFVSLMNGPDNESNYTYMATIFDGTNLRRTKKSKVTAEAKSWKAIDWFWSKLLVNDKQALANLEFWHEGRCGCCGRKLTDPESIARGIGPVCAAKK